LQPACSISHCAMEAWMQQRDAYQSKASFRCLTLGPCLSSCAHSAVGLTDKAGKLVGSISVADLRDLPTDQFGLLLQPVSKVGGMVCVP
jgi:hypothetical protein